MNTENGIPLIREVLLMIWTLTTDSEAGMFNVGGCSTAGAMVGWRSWTGYMRWAKETVEAVTEGQNCVYENK